MACHIRADLSNKIKTGRVSESRVEFPGNIDQRLGTCDNGLQHIMVIDIKKKKVRLFIAYIRKQL
jgi:hypothetical protein